LKNFLEKPTTTNKQQTNKNMSNQENYFTDDDEFREEMRDFVYRLEEQDVSLREARRKYILDYLRIHKGIDIVSIDGNVVYYKKVPKTKH
jgi:hypothetical protein